MRILASAIFLLLASIGFAATPNEEIEALLLYVGGLEGAEFIRNGGSHSASAAVSHMRLKWERQQRKITSAEEFIALCASKSSITGERYRIRFKDGSERFCDEVLTEHLGALRKQASQPVHSNSVDAPRNLGGALSIARSPRSV